MQMFSPLLIFLSHPRNTLFYYTHWKYMIYRKRSIHATRTHWYVKCIILFLTTIVLIASAMYLPVVDLRREISSLPKYITIPSCSKNVSTRNRVRLKYWGSSLRIFFWRGRVVIITPNECHSVIKNLFKFHFFFIHFTLAVCVFWQQHCDYNISSRASPQPESDAGARAPQRETIFNGLCVLGGSSSGAAARPLGSGRVTRNRSFRSHTVATECYPYLTVSVRGNIFYPSVPDWQTFAGPNLLQTTLAAVFSIYFSLSLSLIPFLSMYLSIYLYLYTYIYHYITGVLTELPVKRSRFAEFPCKTRFLSVTAVEGVYSDNILRLVAVLWHLGPTIIFSGIVRILYNIYNILHNTHSVVFGFMFLSERTLYPCFCEKNSHLFTFTIKLYSRSIPHSYSLFGNFFSTK